MNALRFEGKPCIRCGATERYVSSGGCVACTNASSLARARANPARHNAQGAVWNAAHPARRRAIVTKSLSKHPDTPRDWVKANLDKVRAKSRKWGERHPEKKRESHARWVANNPGRSSALTRAWQIAHPAEAKAICAKRRAVKLGAAIGCRKEYAAFVRWVRNAPLIPCHYCKRDTLPTERHIDHYIPLSRGGADAVTNLRVACADCNRRKHALSPDAFMRQTA